MAQSNYNRAAAVEYAKQYAYTKNPKYFDFSLLGGNCTNFVSQCLVAGEAKMNYSYPLGWYYKNLQNRSPSFTGVEYLYNFLVRKNNSVGPRAIETTVEKLEVGDIIQLSFDGIGFSHSLLVTELNFDNPYDPFVTTNTYDVYNKPLSWYSFAKARFLHIVSHDM